MMHQADLATSAPGERDYDGWVDALKGLEAAQVLCIGDIMLDRYIEGKTQRLSPEAPVPILQVGQERLALGGVGNVARNCAAVGGHCRLIARVGQDGPAAQIKALLAEYPTISMDLLEMDSLPTTVKTRYMAGGHQLLRADREKIAPLGAPALAQVLALCEQALTSATPPRVIILSDYGKGMIDGAVAQAVIALAKQYGVAVVIDPKGQDYQRYRGADYVTPNRAELALATGLPTDSDGDILAACNQLVKTCGIGAILATRSEQGMTLYRPGRVDHLPTQAQAVFDVAGAGDTVVALLATGLASGLDSHAAAFLANVAAGIVVGKIGTAVALPAEIRTALRGLLGDGSQFGHHSWDEASQQVAQWRAEGLQVGFTNGCFDLLHPGHMQLLRAARAECDRLVVGLNSDASVSRLKGPMRPVQQAENRAILLAALRMVDLVVIFDQDTPLELITHLRPDILVKGADYRIDQVVGASEVVGWGGRVALVPLVAGQSTSSLVKRMADKKDA